MEQRNDIAIFFTTFPKTSEAFLQRDVGAMQDAGLQVALYSFWGGGGEFRGQPVVKYSMWRLIPLFLFVIPWFFVRHTRIMRDLFAGVFSRKPPSWMNFWENMLGSGFAGSSQWREFSAERPAFIHAAWAGAPATAAWLMWRLHGTPYSVGVHAYDLYEHGGDWWLLEKVAHARFVHTSTEMAREELIRRGVPAGKIHCVRRGLEALPVVKPIRRDRTPLRIICVARLVPKKGLRNQMRIYAALKAAGLGFSARVVGDGPLRGELEKLAISFGVDDCVEFLGQIPHEEVSTQHRWADVLIHTGVVAESGDRDGLPNVIPEAMAAGTIVVTSAVAATTEAIHSGTTGIVVETDGEAGWVQALTLVATDSVLVENLQACARRWVENNYDANRNVAKLIELWRSEMDRGA